MYITSWKDCVENINKAINYYKLSDSSKALLQLGGIAYRKHVGNQVISEIHGIIKMTPLQLCIKHNIPTNNIPVITSGNQIIQQLWHGTVTINQLITPGVQL